jgi:lysophospholipase L1-like esterase
VYVRPRRVELLLALLGVAVVPGFLVLAEGGLALAGRAGVTNETSSGIDLLHRYSEVYGWEPRPGARIEYDGSVVTINADGYRGQRLPRERETDATRVVLLGDSIAFGLDVNDDDTYASLLNARPNGLEVVNLAVQGYGPGQSLLKLEREGMAYHPDVVILAFCVSNDFAEAVLPTFLYDGVHPKPYFTVEAGQLVRHDAHLKLGIAARTAFWLEDHSRLYRWLTAPAPPPEPPRQVDNPWRQRRRDALGDRDTVIETTFRIIARMRAVAASQGAAFLVVLHPDQEAARGESFWADAFESAPLLEGIPVVDLGKRMAEQHLRFKQVARDEIGHLNPRGHELAAEAVEQALEELGLLHYRAVELTGTTPRPPL